MTDDEWRMIDHSPNVALTHAWQWAIAVRAQAERVVEESGSLQKIPDAYLLVIAVRNVRRAADMALEHLMTTRARDQLRQALDDFEAALPGVVKARDVLEHFDDYTRGVGDEQQPTIKKRSKRDVNERLAQQYRIGFDYVDDDRRHPQIRVGPHAINLIEAARAASRLVHEIRAAVVTDQVPRKDPI